MEQEQRDSGQGLDDLLDYDNNLDLDKVRALKNRAAILEKALEEALAWISASSPAIR